MLKDLNEEVAARLTMLEFMLEVLMARYFSDLPSEAEELIVSELTRLKSMGTTSDALDDLDSAMRVLQRSGQMQDHFLEKVQSRSAQIRHAAG